MEPAVAWQDRARRLIILVVAREDGRPFDQDFAVLSGLHVDSGDRRPDGAELEAIRAVNVGCGRLLRLPVALEDEDVERMEELGDLLRQRGAAGDRGPKPPAEARLDLRVDEPVRNAVPEREPAGNRLLTLP